MLLRKVSSVFCALPILLAACSADPWVPDGGWQLAPKKGDPAHCDNFYLQQLLLEEPAHKPEAHAQILRAFLKKCEGHLSKDAPGYYSQLSASIQIQYDIDQNPARRDLAINLRAIDLEDARTLTGTSLDLEPGRLRVRGKLFLKSDGAPRPLVIVKCGLQCDLSSSTLKFLVSLLFDEGPFHLLLLPNVTAESFQIDNKIVSLGGFDEGRQILAVAKFVQSPEFQFRSRVSRVHVAGISLGGHSALYSALYNSHNLNESGGKYITSVFAGCPVVDLKESVYDLYDGSFLGGIFADLFWGQMKGVAPYVPVLGDYLEKLRGNFGVPVHEALAQITTPYYREVTMDPRWAYEPLSGYVVNDSRDMWRFNDFTNFAELNTTPTFIWASRDDEIVEARKNTDLILKKFSKNLPPNYRILVSDRGYHCGYTDAYTWRVAGVALRSVFISQSPELKYLQNTLVKKLDYADKGPNFESRKIYRDGLKWKINAGDATVKLVHDLSSYCGGWFSNCPKFQEAHVPFSAFGLNLDLIPKTEVQAQALTRWLNANVFVSGKQLGWLGAREEPQTISWVVYGDPRAGPQYVPVQPNGDLSFVSLKKAPALETSTKNHFIRTILNPTFK